MKRKNVVVAITLHIYIIRRIIFASIAIRKNVLKFGGKTLSLKKAM
jgi:hypothetical protein